MNNTQEAAPSGKMAGSSSKQAAPKYFTISPQLSGTKYYLTASGRDVTLEKAEKAEKADFPATQLWEKKEAFFLFSKSQPECALVEQLPNNRPSSTRVSASSATSRSADSQIELLRPLAMDGGLWTASDDLGGGFIYIQESDLGKGLIYIQKASDTKLVFGEVPGRTVELHPEGERHQTGSDPNHEPTSRSKIEPLERKGTKTPPIAGSSSKQADHEYFTISQQYGKKYYYLAASGTGVTLDLEIKNAEEDEKTYFPATQLWEKKEVFFLFSKSKAEKQKKADNHTTVKKADNRPIGLRKTPAMDGLWTESPPDKDKLIYIQKASDTKRVFNAEIGGNASDIHKVELQPKGTGRPTSRWKMEPREPAQAAIGASGSGSHTDGKHTGEDPKKRGCTADAAAAASFSAS